MISPKAKELKQYRTRLELELRGALIPFYDVTKRGEDHSVVHIDTSDYQRLFLTQRYGLSTAHELLEPTRPRELISFTRQPSKAEEAARSNRAREVARAESWWRLRVNGQLIAKARRQPYKSIELMESNADNKFEMKVLESIVMAHLPKVAIVYT